jgi:transcriptional regulator with XRE-family HTH domain
MPTPRERHEPPTPGTAAPTSRRATARATQEVMRGRGRADAVAARLGVGLRDARGAAGMSQAEAASRARISQARWSELERGVGANAPIELWAVVAAAVGVQLAAFLEAVSGANLPRDIEHLRRQSAVVERAAPGGWSPAPEMPVTRGGAGRVIDVFLTRAPRREAAVVEVWDLLLDVGAAFRSFDDKLAAVRAQLPGWTVSGVWILRGTRRNRGLVAELAPLFAARFPGDGRALLAAFDRPTRALPPAPVLLWTDAAATSLSPWRPVGGARRAGSRP